MLQVYIDAKPLGPSKLFSLLYLTRNRILSILFSKKKKNLTYKGKESW